MTTTKNYRTPPLPLIADITDRFWATLMLTSPIILIPALGLVFGFPYRWPAFMPLGLGALALVWSLVPLFRRAVAWVLDRRVPRAASVARTSVALGMSASHC